MTNYIPNHSKKRERLIRLEEDLLRLIERGASREKLLECAIHIRDGRISVIRAKQNQNPETSAELRAVYLEDQSKIEALRLLAAVDVLAEYLP